MYGNAVLHLYVRRRLRHERRTLEGWLEGLRPSTHGVRRRPERERETGNAERQGTLSDRGSTGLGYWRPPLQESLSTENIGFCSSAVGTRSNTLPQFTKPIGILAHTPVPSCGSVTVAMLGYMAKKLGLCTASTRGWPCSLQIYLFRTGVESWTLVAADHWLFLVLGRCEKEDRGGKRSRQREKPVAEQECGVQLSSEQLMCCWNKTGL